MEKQIIEKIRKLLALSEDAKNQGSLEEAANAAAKVQDILMKYNLSMAEVNKEKESLVSETAINVLRKGWNHRHGKWIFHLYKAIATVNLCDIYVQITKGHEKVFIIGEENNREIVEYMADQLISRLYQMQRYAWKKYRGPEKQGAFRRGYFMGAVVAIGNKLKESFEKAAEASPETQSLVQVKDQAIRDYLRNKNLKKARPSKVTGRDGFRNGHRDGKNLSIHKGVERNALNQNLIT